MITRFSIVKMALAAVLLITVGGPFHGRATALALSLEDERILGEQFLNHIRGRFEFVEDPFANRYITNLGQYLVTPLEPKPFPFHFYLIKDNTLNAFAAPGGHIFVFTGLVEAFDTVDELANVLCHEIGHVSARHLAERMEQNKKIGLATLAGVLAAVLIGGEAAGPLMTGSLAGGMQAQLHYSRMDERQADQLGFRYMESTGFDPAAMISALKKLEKGSWLGTEKIPTYLLTHPTGPERMANLDSLLSGRPPLEHKKKAEAFEALFPTFKTVIRAKSQSPEDAVSLFRSQLEKEPDSSLNHLGLGIALLEMSEGAQAAAHLEKALEENPGSTLTLRYLGEAYLATGRRNDAVSTLEKVVAIDDQDSSALFLLALAYEESGAYEKAILLLERLAAFPGVQKEVFYHLGMSYGKSNRLALAHYNFGLYFKALKEMQKAKFHFDKALEFSPSEPGLKEKILRAAQRGQG